VDLQVRPCIRWAVCLLIGLSPGLLHVGRTVNPSAASLATGALVALAVIRWELGRWSLPVLLVVAAAVPWVKADNLFAVAAASLYLMIRAAVARRGCEPRRARVLALGSVLTSAVAVGSQAGWLALRHASAISFAVPPSSVMFTVDHLTVGQVVSAAPALTGSLGAHGDTAGTVAFFTGILLIGACLGAVLYRRVDLPEHGWAVATLAMMILGGPLLVLMIFFGQGQYFPLPGRYGIPLVGFAAIALGRGVRNAVAAGAVYLLAGAALAGAVLTWPRAA
jgi:hypothetical protein